MRASYNKVNIGIIAPCQLFTADIPIIKHHVGWLKHRTWGLTHVGLAENGGYRQVTLLIGKMIVKEYTIAFCFPICAFAHEQH